MVCGLLLVVESSTKQIEKKYIYWSNKIEIHIEIEKPTGKWSYFKGNVVHGS